MSYYEISREFYDNTALIMEGKERLSYRQMAEYCDSLKKDIPERALAFILCENSIGSVCSYIGCLSNRTVPLLLDKNMDHALVQSLLDTYEPEYLFLPAASRKQFGDFDCIREQYGYCILRTAYNRKCKMYEELALLLTTSGSTGSPKLVRQSYSNIQSNAEAIAQYLEISSLERPVTSLPMNYTYGLSVINSHLLKGAAIVLTSRTLMEREFWQLMKEEDVTSIAGVPYTYEMLKRLRFFKMQLPALKTMTQAGGKLSPELHKEFAEYANGQGKRFIVMYGQTEATARMSYLPGEKSLDKYGSVGISIPGGEFSLIDIDGNVIEKPEVTGELVYKGPNVTLGYAECREDLEKEDERKGILITGDMAKRDEDGFYYIVGRKKRFLKIFGNRVNLDEVERILKRQYEDGDYACVGRDDKMYVYAAGVEEDSLAAIRSFLAEKMKLHSSALVIRAIDAIPKNEAGKTLYVQLKTE